MREYVRALREWLRRRLRSAYDAYRLRRALRETKSNLRTVIGASGTAYAGWISSEYLLVNVAELRSLQRFFTEGSVDAILAEHVWEHLWPDQGAAGARNCHWLLRGGGRLRIAVPDGQHPDKKYIDAVKPGGHGAGSDDHKVLYTPHSVTELLEDAGFKVTLLEWFHTEGQFQYREWDPALGYISRLTRFDERNRRNPTAYTSLIVDAVNG